MSGNNPYLLSSSPFVTKKKKKEDDPLAFYNDLSGYTENAIPNPIIDAQNKGLAPLYAGQPISNWVPKGIAESFKSAIQDAEDPADMESRLNTAYYLSLNKGISFSDAFKDMDNIIAADYGVAMSPKTWYEAVSNTWKASYIGLQESQIYAELLKKDYNTWEEYKKDPLYAQAQALEAQMPPMDVMKRSLPTKALKLAAEAMPSMIESAKAGGIGSMIGLGLGMAAGAALVATGTLPAVGAATALLGGGLATTFIPTIGMVGATLFGGVAAEQKSMALESGGLFRDLLNYQSSTGEKLNPHVASYMAQAYGAVAAVIETMQIDELAKSSMSLLNSAQKRAVGEAVEATMKSAGDASARSGAFMRFINEKIPSWLKETAWETAEEDLQQGAEILATAIARQVSNKLENTSIPHQTIKEIGKELIDTTVGSFVGFAIPIGLGAGFKKFAGIRETGPVLQSVKQDAKPATVLPKGVTINSQQYEAYAAEAEKPMPAGTHFQNRALGDEFELTAGTSKGKPLSHLTYTAEPSEVEGSPGTVTITAFAPGKNPSVDKALVLDLSQKYAGWDIQWETQTPQAEALKTYLETNNRRGTGIQWFSQPIDTPDTATLESTKAIIQNARPTWSPQDVEDAVFVAKPFAVAFGMQVDDLVGKSIAPKVLDTSLIGANQQGAFGAAKQANFDGVVKTLIDLAPTANPATFTHEAVHAFMTFGQNNRNIPQIDAFMQEAEKVFGVQNGNWRGEFLGWTQDYKYKNRSAEEALAYGLEDYIATGKAPTKESEGFFKRMAKFLYDLYQSVKARVKLTPEITQFYDNLFTASPIQDTLTAPASQSIASGTILNQGEDGTLAVLHNINADQIAQANDFGGFPSPSLAVTRPNIDFTQFGNSTLIADPKVAQRAMEQRRLYDRDVWSPTVPRPEWKINRKILSAIDSKLLDAGKKLGRYFGIDSLNTSDVTDGANRLITTISRTAEAKYVYLLEIGQKPELVTKKITLPAPKSVMDAVDKFMDSNNYNIETADQDVAKVIKKALLNDPKYKDKVNLPGIRKLYENGNVIYNIQDFLSNHKKEGTEVDYYATEDLLNEKLKGKEEAFNKWLADQISPAYSEPKIKVGGKKIAFNAKGVYEWMQKQAAQGSQETMTYGPKKAQSMAGRPFRSREALRAKEGSLVSSQEAEKAWQDKIEPITNEINDKLPQYYKYSDTWDALNSTYRALGRYLKGGVTIDSTERMRKSLSAELFYNVPRHLVQKMVDLAHEMANAPQDYYEAKPNEILTLKDFMAAVVPASTSEATKEAIRKTGLKVFEYSTAEERGDAIRSAMSQLDNVLFQGDTDTPEFKQWFGDSKVVDESGKPLVVYHGTTAKNIDAFKPAVEGNGIYFTSSKDVAESYSGKGKRADTYETYLSFKDPLIVDAEGGYWGDLSKAKVLSQDGTATPWTVSQLFGYQNSFTNALAKKVRTSGFDSIIIKNIHDQGSKIKHQLDASTVYIALDPTQIKSVYNRGTWDANDPRILYQGKLNDQVKAEAQRFAEAGDTDTPEFKKWFGDSKALDDSGRPLVVYHGTNAENIESFEPDYIGYNYDIPGGFHFTTNSEIAHGYGDNTIKTYLSIKNPLVYDLEKKIGKVFNDFPEDQTSFHSSSSFYDRFYDELLAEAKYNGNDSIVIRDRDGEAQYIVFDSTQIKSVKNNGIWDANDPRILYQGKLNDQVKAEAQRFAEAGQTPEQFIEYMETPLMEDERIAWNIPDLPPEEKQKWYREAWDAAIAPSPETEPTIAEWVKGLTDNNYAGIRKFLSAIWENVIKAQDAQPEIGSTPEEIQLFLDQKNAADEMRDEIAPPIISGALAIGSGRNVSNTFLSSLYGIIKAQPEEYARIWGDTTGDKKIGDLGKKAEAQKNPEIEPEQKKRMTISERAALAKNIKDENLAKAIISGKVVAGEEVSAYVKQLKNKAKAAVKREAELNGEIKALEAEVDQNTQVIGAQRAERQQVQAELKKVIARTEKLVAAGQKIPEVLQSQRVSIEKKLAAISDKLVAAQDWIEIERQMQKQQRRADNADLNIQQDKARGEKVSGEDVRIRQDARNKVAELSSKLAVAKDYKNSAQALTYLAKLEERTKLQDQYRQRTAEQKNLRELKAYKEKLVRQVKNPAGKGMAVQYQEQIAKLQQSATEKGMAKLSINELETLATKIKLLREIGNAVQRAKGEQFSMKVETDRAEVSQPIIENKDYAEPNGLDLTKPAKKNFLNRVKEAKYSAINARRFIRDVLDGGVDGPNVQRLWFDKENRLREQLANQERRNALINNAILRAGQNPESWFTEKYTIPGAGPQRGDIELRKTDLMAVEMAFRNEDSRNAVLYGDFFSANERAEHKGDELWFDIEGSYRFEQIMNAIEQNLSPDDMKILEAYKQDADETAPRLAKVMADVYNKPFKTVENYYMIIRQGATEKIDEQMQNEYGSRAISGKAPPRRGFTKERVTIKPWNQTPVKLDLLKTWSQSIDRQEHLISYAGYTKEVDATYRNPVFEEDLKTIGGQAAVSYLYDYLDNLKNPQEMADAQKNDALVKMVRGNVAFGALAFRTASMMTQLTTSVWPAMQYSGPIRLMAEAAKMMSNPITYLRETEEMSIRLRARAKQGVNVMMESIKTGNADTKLGKGVQKVENFGMKGLELVDRFSVAVGWRAMYDRYLVEFGDEQKALEMADDKTMMTQPSSFSDDLSPMFRNKSGWQQIVLQFQTSLNVIWQNIAYDMPAAIRAKNLGWFVGIATSYAIAGILLKAVKSPPAPPDETPEEKAKRLFFWGITQGTDSIPLVGQMATGFAQRLITGEKPPVFPDSMFPGVQDFFNGLSAVTEGDMEKAGKDFLDSSILIAPIPVQAIKDAKRIKEGDLGAITGRPKQ